MSAWSKGREVACHLLQTGCVESQDLPMTGAKYEHSQPPYKGGDEICPGISFEQKHVNGMPVMSLYLAQSAPRQFLV